MARPRGRPRKGIATTKALTASNDAANGIVSGDFSRTPITVNCLIDEAIRSKIRSKTFKSVINSIKKDEHGLFEDVEPIFDPPPPVICSCITDSIPIQKEPLPGPIEMGNAYQDDLGDAQVDLGVQMHVNGDFQDVLGVKLPVNASALLEATVSSEKKLISGNAKTPQTQTNPIPDQTTGNYQPDKSLTWNKLAKVQAGMTLHFCSNSALSSKVEVCAADFEGEFGFCKYTLMGNALGAKPTLAQMQTFVTKYWNHVATPTVQYYKRGWFSFRFTTQKDMEGVLNGGPWSIGSNTIVLKQWHPMFTKEMDQVSKVPIWILFPDLDPLLWSDKVLSKLASKIGKPLYADVTTTTKARLSFARVLVEADLATALPENIILNTPIHGQLNQRVVYEWMPYYCTGCRKMGHTLTHCKHNKAKQTPPRTEWQATQPTAVVAPGLTTSQAAPALVSGQSRNRAAAPLTSAAVNSTRKEGQTSHHVSAGFVNHATPEKHQATITAETDFTTVTPIRKRGHKSHDATLQCDASEEVTTQNSFAALEENEGVENDPTDVNAANPKGIRGKKGHRNTMESEASEEVTDNTGTAPQQPDTNQNCSGQGGKKGQDAEAELVHWVDEDTLPPDKQHSVNEGITQKWQAHEGDVLAIGLQAPQ